MLGKLFDISQTQERLYTVNLLSALTSTIPLKQVLAVRRDSIEYRSVTSSKNLFAFQHFHDHISVEHDEKPPHTNNMT